MTDERLKPKHIINRLVSSPMRRCMLTATPVSKALGLPIEVRGDVHEHGGCFSGARDQQGVVGETGLTKVGGKITESL